MMVLAPRSAGGFLSHKCVEGGITQKRQSQKSGADCLTIIIRGLGFYGILVRSVYQGGSILQAVICKAQYNVVQHTGHLGLAAAGPFTAVNINVRQSVHIVSSCLTDTI